MKGLEAFQSKSAHSLTLFRIGYIFNVSDLLVNWMVCFLFIQIRIYSENQKQYIKF